MKHLNTYVLSVALLFLLASCKSDLRTKMVKEHGITDELTQQGKDILQKAWNTHGLNTLNKHTVYAFNGQDTWKGVLGSVGKVWPEKKMNLEFKYKIGSFDGQVKYLSGKHKGEIKGLQNWNYYEIDQDTTFIKPNSRVQFGISAYQYFTEMIDRLKHAPIILYAGEGEMRGEKYDLVFCTWESVKPNKDMDQYIAWVNKKTGLLEFTQFTIRENFLKMPGGKMVYGGVEYSNLKSIDGILVPHTQTIYSFNLKTNAKRFLHKLEVSDFKFDSFPLDDLKINKTIAKSGDFK